MGYVLIAQATGFSVSAMYTRFITYEAGDAMESYVYFVFFLSTFVNFLLLVVVNCLFDDSGVWLRLVAGAIVGGIYSGFCLLPEFSFLGGIFWRSVCLWCIALVSFGFSMSTLRRGAVFFLLSMALSGVVAMLGSTGFLAVLFSAFIVLIICGLGLYRYFNPEHLTPVELSYGNITRTVTALRDTGNTLIDPVTGESVLVISAELAEVFTGLSRRQLKDPVGSMGQIPGLRLIPYRTVGNDRGMLLALRFPKVKIGAKKGSGIVAFSGEKLHKDGKYQALTGGFSV